MAETNNQLIKTLGKNLGTFNSFNTVKLKNSKEQETYLYYNIYVNP